MMNMWHVNIIIWLAWYYVHISWYEHGAWLSIEHYILCASMYISFALRYVRHAASLRGSHSFQLKFSLCVARLVTTRGLGVYCPQYVLIIFIYAGFRTVKYVLSDYVGLWAKVVYLHLVYSLCAWHFYVCNQTIII